MRRKVIQDFANVFCQRILQLPEGYDLASFAHYGSGTYELNVLTGECSFNGNSIPTLRTCVVFKEWLFLQLDKHSIAHDGIEAAGLRIEVTVSEISARQFYGQECASAHFTFGCESAIRTAEKTYTSTQVGEKTWEFGWYYTQLYGSVPGLAS